jgi:3-hydroxybutyryl-CoA dehydrogenase
MGAGVAEAAARAGIDVHVIDLSESMLERGRQRVITSIARAQKSGKLTEYEAEDALSHIEFSAEMKSIRDSQLVIEAVIESETDKIAVFKQIDKRVKSPNAVLASNTSSIPIMKLAMATNRPSQVIGIHFFNPVPVLPLVEIVTSLLTNDKTTSVAHEFATNQLGKEVIRSQDRAGFIVNALLIPYILSAVRMLESGFATSEDIDAGMVKGCAHPMGPLALADLIGLDTTTAVADSLYEEFKEPLYAPPPLLARMVEAGLFGRKSGRGFYVYEE